VRVSATAKYLMGFRGRPTGHECIKGRRVEEARRCCGSCAGGCRDVARVLKSATANAEKTQPVREDLVVVDAQATWARVSKRWQRGLRSAFPITSP